MRNKKLSQEDQSYNQTADNPVYEDFFKIDDDTSAEKKKTF